MLKIVWMSDPHFVHHGTVLQHDPRVRLTAAISHINQHHGDSAFCVISGDMVNRGTREDYSALRVHLDTLSVPYLPMVGNHDDRELFRENLPLPATCMEAFIQYSIETDSGTLVCLDTLKPGSDAGELCAARLDWLARTLETAGDCPVYLFMHHPPMALGLPMQDTDGLENGVEFLELLARLENVKHLFIGHVHRPITGTVHGIPFATMRSVLYQAPAPKPDWNWDTFRPGDEAPCFGILTLSDLGVNLQYTQFCNYEDGVISN